MKSILDPTFRYANAASTNLRKTFARIRREQRVAAEAAAAEAAERGAKVRELKRGGMKHG